MKAWWLVALAALWLGGCAGGGGSRPADVGGAAGAPGIAGDGERYAMSSDAYPEEPPDVSQVPDAVPRVEAPSRAGNRASYEVWGKTYHVLPDASGYERRGTASWYGKKFHGYATSNGEIYDMYKMSAAHRSLPLPTYARVTNLDNNRSVIVRVNDRGPFHSEREIDLSYAAAARLDILDRGTGRVRVEAIDARDWQARRGDAAASRDQPATAATVPSAPEARSTEAGQGAASGAVNAASGAGGPAAPQDPADGGPAGHRPIYLQVAALGSADNARALKVRLQASLDRPVRVASAAGMHRVQVGPLENSAQLDPLRGELRRAGFDKAFVVDGAE
ncbi:septal ring lytic transglycosylase RlpA family protein [Halomonas nitroreducens]|uniref:Endolytic peptidoglycan transglycosylase RlpA n=1 Tax=Halomonas nitroreducens TaxID=447425 RepID=A0A431V4U3_9GAMM|nr:septal ring lytic transglycosylase RlpA family protein [Halomonas nitroreducens]RTR05297.1 septal ring lytic transglycosylase RlpA family protein [Halomonas nitroreducens]